MKGFGFLKLFAPLLYIPCSALAAENAEEFGAISSGYLMRLTLGLIVIVAIIFFIAWVLKRSNLTQQSAAGVIQIVAGLALGTRDRLVLVQVGEEQILLGLSPGRIQKLHVMEEAVDIENATAEMSSFARKLSEIAKDKIQK